MSIAEPEETLLSPTEDPARSRQFPASVASKRMTRRPQMPSNNSSSRLSLVSTTSMEENMSSDAASVPHIQTEERDHLQHAHDKLLSQVAEWLNAEKAKQVARKCKNRTSKEYEQPVIVKQETDSGMTSRPRTSSQSSNSSALITRAIAKNTRG